MTDISYDVRIHKTVVYQGNQEATHWVRWRVGTRRFKAKFKTAALARSFRSSLTTAASRGEAFRISDGRPVSLVREDEQTSRVSWLDAAQTYVDSHWKGDAPSTRRSRAEALTAITVGLLDGVDIEPPDRDALRRALQTRVFNTKARESEADPEISKTLDWLEGVTLNVDVFENAKVLRSVIDILGATIDGGKASANYFNRRRGVLNNFVNFAMDELGVLTRNPLKEVSGTWVSTKRARTTVDRRTVVNPEQAEKLLDAFTATDERGRPVLWPSAPRFKAFFGCLYYAALRPEEAANLRESVLDLPDEGWGWLYLDDVAPDVAGSWTDSGERREERAQLKHREVGDGRRAPCPPPLTALLHWHLRTFGTDQQGRLFSATRRSGPIATTTYCKLWSLARQHALTPQQVASPLAKDPYSLRHAAVSTWLNGGVGAAQVAEWAGHSKKVLLEIYAKCLDGQDEVARQRIEAALQTSGERSEDRRPTLQELSSWIDDAVGTHLAAPSSGGSVSPDEIAGALAKAWPGIIRPTG